MKTGIGGVEITKRKFEVIPKCHLKLYQHVQLNHVMAMNTYFQLYIVSKTVKYTYSNSERQIMVMPQKLANPPL